MAKDLYGLTDSGIAPELQAEYRGLTRKQAIEEAMLQQAMKPNRGLIDAGRYKVAPSALEGLGQMANVWAAQKGLEESDKKFAALGQRQADLTADEVRRYGQMKMGTPEVPATPAVTDVAQTNQSMDTFDPQAAVAGQAAVPGNARGAIDAFAASRNPVLQSIMARDYAAMTKPPVKTDLGDKWKVEYPDGRVMYESKSATPDAILKEGGSDRRFAGVSGNTAATITSADTRHATPSGNAILGEKGQNARHATPSGSAILGSNTTLQTHATPSGSAVLSAETARRGQDQAVNPEIQGRLAEWKAAGAERGKSTEEARVALPAAIASAKQQVDLIDQMIGDLSVKDGKLVQGKKAPHPGFSVSVGASAQPGLQYVSGTDKAGFYALNDQVKGGNFLEAFKTLKGGGAITEIEGTKATSAITRMSTTQNEKEFVEAARELQGIIRAATERSTQRVVTSTPTNPGRRSSDGGGTTKFDANGNPVQ
tara:strand:+ start:3077 stop:4522 length:1446 start_codon:yes stop_codon:yes gene_type:complete